MSVFNSRFIQYLDKNNISIKTYQGFNKDIRKYGFWELNNNIKETYGSIYYTIDTNYKVISTSMSSDKNKMDSIGHILPFIMLHLVFSLYNENYHINIYCPYETVSENCFLCEIDSKKCLLCNCKQNGIHKSSNFLRYSNCSSVSLSISSISNTLSTKS